MLRAAAGLLALAGAGCLDDPPVAPVSGDVALRLQAQLPSSLADRTLQVRVSFIRNSDEARVDLPVTPSQLVVPGGETVQRSVSVQVSQCFAEGTVTREEGGVVCPLIIELTLTDAGGGVLATETRTVDLARGARSLVVPPFSLGVVTLSGVVRNALNNAPVGGIAVALYAGATATGTPLATSTTGSDGIYVFSGVTAGTYAVSASGSGILATTRGPIVVGTTSVSADIVVSPVLAANEVRVVLTWGATPPDLDSHLYGPAAAGNFHIYYANPGALPYAELDRDDTDAFGPETVTLRTVATGSHLYAVHDFTNQDVATSRALATSGARVQVYRSTGLVADFTVPNLAGTLWTVFELNGTTITPINRMSSADPGTRPAALSASVAAPVAGGASASRAASSLPPKTRIMVRP